MRARVRVECGSGVEGMMTGRGWRAGVNGRLPGDVALRRGTRVWGLGDVGEG